MRVPVQRYLILWLCLFSPSLAFAVGSTTSETQAEAYTLCLEAEATKEAATAYDYRCVVQAEYTRYNLNYYSSPTDNYRLGTQHRYYWNTDSPECDPITGECSDPSKSPEECSEIGELYDPTTQQCVTECEYGMFNGSCLLPPEENPECSKDSPDYRGEVVLGYGTSPIPACGNFDQCSGNTPGQVGFVNGELRCIPEDYGIPSCQGDSITVIDEYGFVCEPLSDVPEEPETPEEPNTDTDGDGTPDEYQRENDPESVDKGLDKVQEGINDTNTKLDGTNKRLDKVGKALEGVNKNLKDGLGTANQTLNSINDTLNNAFDAPEGGFSSEGLNVIPTLTETATGFKQAIMGNELIQAVGGLAEIPSQTSCPVWTVPSTPISDAQTITIHCDILEDNRGVFSLLFMFFWTGVALFAFLRA
ncbi:hypothetical protein MD273_14195 [Marinobacter pelagius]|uniref:hypothetical protein n=1 Tax=Marinobacter sp. C7 TaxID=2951363 RepID=UPI001EF021B0|nr:hypothetical protein [Marinobacter sp. C7]MCG7200883.1 hypothetical protein [Marinobacter sp. C7]